MRSNFINKILVLVFCLFFQNISYSAETFNFDVINELHDKLVQLEGAKTLDNLVDVSPYFELAPKDIRWHMIGKLQRNKVKFIAPFIHLIHSVFY